MSITISKQIAIAILVLATGALSAGAPVILGRHGASTTRIQLADGTDTSSPSTVAPAEQEWH
jgi:hypothetical protein